MEKRTELKEVIHLYCGSPCKFQYVDWNNWNDGIVDGAMLYKIEGDLSFWVKPILRRLSSMTEEEARQFLKIDGIDAFTIVITDRCIQYDLPGRTNEWAFDPCDYGMPGNPSQFQYLLSKGFDLFNLIDSGQAIEQTEK